MHGGWIDLTTSNLQKSNKVLLPFAVWYGRPAGWRLHLAVADSEHDPLAVDSRPAMPVSQRNHPCGGRRKVRRAGHAATRIQSAVRGDHGVWLRAVGALIVLCSALGGICITLYFLLAFHARPTWATLLSKM